VFKAGIDRKPLNDWWIGRAIPASRSGLQDALLALGIASPTYLLEKCYGLSLSDQYWICPKGSALEWEEEQITLVSDFSWFSAEKLDGIGEEIMDIFNTSPDVDAERRKAIADAVDKRAKQIEQLRQNARAGILLDRLYGHQQAIAETPGNPDGKKHEQSL
jgi:hypothetical protein